jgi:transposase
LSNRRPARIRPADPPPSHFRRGETPLFGLNAAVRVYLAIKPADRRKSFDALSALVSSLSHDPLSGHLLVFVNKRRDRIKFLYWDRDGLAVWAKK